MNIRYCLNMLLSNSYSPISFLNIVLIFSYEFFLTKKKKKSYGQSLATKIVVA